jgi:hypothetical protein
MRTVDTAYDYSLKDVDQTMNDAEAFIEEVIKKVTPSFPKSCRFKHSGARGDLVYGLAAIKAAGGGELFVRLSAQHYHHTGTPMTEKELVDLAELLGTQKYISGVQKFVKGKSGINVDLDDFRNCYVDRNHLSRSHLMAIGTNINLAEPWIDPNEIKPKHVADIVVSRSSRYHGPFDWGELLSWRQQCVFVGLEKEHAKFNAVTGLQIPYHKTETVLELAQVIRGSKLFVGNQSFPYALAEAMKQPRALEVCGTAPNCYPQDKSGFTRLGQDIIRHFLFGEPVDSRGNTRRFPRKASFFKEYKKTDRVEGRPMISVIVPHLDESVGADIISQLASWTEKWEVVVPATGAEVLGAKVSDADGSFERRANKMAAFSGGSYLLVLDFRKKSSVSLVEKVALKLRKIGGFVGTWLSLDGYPHVCGGCFGMVRSVYQEGGLYNERMRSGKWNMLEMNLRYTSRGCSCQCVGQEDGFEEDGDEASCNAQYIKDVYGVAL